MSNDSNRGSGCCTTPIQSITTLTLSNGSHIGIIGLEEILKQMHREDKPVTVQTAQAIIERLKEKNYIPFSIIQEYEVVLLREYRKYIEAKQAKNI